MCSIETCVIGTQIMAPCSGHCIVGNSRPLALLHLVRGQSYESCFRPLRCFPLSEIPFVDSAWTGVWSYSSKRLQFERTFWIHTSSSPGLRESVPKRWLRHGQYAHVSASMYLHQHVFKDSSPVQQNMAAIL